MIVYVVPCGAEKLDHAARAAELYTGSAFRHVYNAALADARDLARDGVEVRVLILSALHGLITPDTVIEPYNVKMGDPASITVDALAATAEAAGIAYGDEVYALLPKAYRARLAEALGREYINVQDVYEAAPGIGYQRGVASAIVRTIDALPLAG